MPPQSPKGEAGRKFQLLATLFYKKTFCSVFQNLFVLAPLRALRETKKLRAFVSSCLRVSNPSIPQGGSWKKAPLIRILFYKKLRAFWRRFPNLCVLAPLRALRETKNFVPLMEP
jgi:hypothetical protein